MTRSMTKRLDKDEAQLKAAVEKLGILMSSMQKNLKDLEQLCSILEKRFTDGWSDERVGQGSHKEWWALRGGPATRH